MNINKKYLPLIIGVALAAGIFVGGKLSFTDAPDRLFTSNSKKTNLIDLSITSITNMWRM